MRKVCWLYFLSHPRLDVLITFGHKGNITFVGSGESLPTKYMKLNQKLKLEYIVCSPYCKDSVSDQLNLNL
jgi:hypothetical protein